MAAVYLTDSATDSIRHLVEQPGLTVAASPSEAGKYLLVDLDGLNLCRAGEKGRTKADFSGEVAQYRHAKGGGELIMKAVNHTAWPAVWDATGDLERDSLVLALLGLSVHAFEQNPAVACLLLDGLTRVLQDDDIRDITQRITLHLGNACALMPELALQTGRPNMVYLDPMYPERQESVAVRKEMICFHGLVGALQDETALLVTVWTIARKRIVVKRLRLGTFSDGEKPAYQYAGKGMWSDVYLPFSPVTKK